MKDKRIVVAGHISLDITPEFHNSGKQKLPELLKPGKLLRVGEAKICAGGCVSNTGLGLCRLGSDVLLMGKVGDDYFGSIMKESIMKAGCGSCIATALGERTSYTIVIAPRGMDRIFLHDAGCNDTFGREDVEMEAVRGSAHFHFGYPMLMRRFYLNGGEELVRLFQSVKEQGVTTSLDLAAIDPESEAAECDWKEILRKVLPYVDFFVPSIEELGYILDRRMYQTWQDRSGGEDVTANLSIQDDLKGLAKTALGMGTRAVLLKCGVAGLYMQTASKTVFAKELPELAGWSDFEHFEKSYVADRVLSATGAGDTSIAAFLKAMLEGYPPEWCMRLAAAEGASCVTAYDAVSGLKSLEELKAKIEAGWKKQEMIRP